MSPSEWQVVSSVSKAPQCGFDARQSVHCCFTVPLDGAARFCCCYGLWAWKMLLLRRCAFVVVQSVPIFSSVKFYSTSFVSPGILQESNFIYGELLSEFYLFDAKSYFAKVEKN